MRKPDRTGQRLRCPFFPAPDRRLCRCPWTLPPRDHRRAMATSAPGGPAARTASHGPMGRARRWSASSKSTTTSARGPRAGVAGARRTAGSSSCRSDRDVASVGSRGPPSRGFSSAGALSRRPDRVQLRNGSPPSPTRTSSGAARCTVWSSTPSQWGRVRPGGGDTARLPPDRLRIAASWSADAGPATPRASSGLQPLGRARYQPGGDK
jgi:hypothetical protein